MKITQLPPNYPEGFVFDAYVDKQCTPNRANYYNRGWVRSLRVLAAQAPCPHPFV